jgi:NAD(P)-dependent dehydrogenase (short-subunit alcohol dehydrogenase family)
VRLAVSEHETAIVTGASSGIGLAIARAFLEEGYNVIGNARSADRLAAAHRELRDHERFVPVPGDVSEPATAARLFDVARERFARVHVLVNNAGIFASRAFVEYGPAELEAFIATNLKGFVYTSQEAVRHMLPLRSGHIVNVTASIALQPLASVPAVVPILIKGGLNHATRALALELAPHGIKVSAVAPGIVDTPLYTKDMHPFLSTLQPSGRIGSARDIAEAVLYLARAKFTTGVVLPVDGGMSSGRF